MVQAATSVERDLLELFRRQVPASMVGNVGVGSVTAVVLWLSGIRDGVPLWFGTVLALVALRTWHARGMTERALPVPMLPGCGACAWRSPA